MATCQIEPFHLFVVTTWLLLVQLALTRINAVVAGDEIRYQKRGPPYKLLVQGPNYEQLVIGFWIIYLDLSSTYRLQIVNNPRLFFLEMVIFALILAKTLFQSYAFRKARQSYALGRNPGLVSSYMKQLQLHEASQLDEQSAGDHVYPPPLLVMEDEMQVDKNPEGYVFSGDSGSSPTKNTGLVTLDKVWQLDNVFPLSTPPIKDLCLSFALFKLTRCQLAGCALTNAGSRGTQNFFWCLMMNDGKKRLRACLDLGTFSTPWTFY
uniref:DUF4220 domain-containing protein n=1 Tax=Leersia perrieri TaxID=77586 RepID=A0A0D9W2G0_9ORYZ